jgi:hypothetical protein
MQRVDLEAERLKIDTPLRGGWVAGAVGVIALAIAGLLAGRSEHGAEEFFHSYLANFMFYLSLALGGLFFVLVTHLTRAGWSVALRRIAEVVAWAVVPLAPLALVVVFGMHDLYEWTHTEAVANDAILQGKSAWLNETFFIVRLAIYFLVWIAMATYFLRKSVAQDRTGDVSLTLRMESRAAPAVIVYAVTLTLAAFDLMMSLYPHWYSTIYGVYYFAGSILGFFALSPLLLAILRRRGYLTRILTSEHAHDMGKLMFAFVVFWAYIAFSQYMLIWYGNLPEETVFYQIREAGDWVWISLLLLFGHFVLPFLFLMSRHPKRRSVSLVAGACWLLFMHWIDIFYLVMPTSRPEGNPFRLADLLCFVGLGGIFLAVVFWRMGQSNLIPVRDPRLAESLSFENA